MFSLTYLDDFMMHKNFDSLCILSQRHDHPLIHKGKLLNSDRSVIHISYFGRMDGRWRHSVCEDHGSEDREDVKKHPCWPRAIEGEYEYTVSAPHLVCKSDYGPLNPDDPIPPPLHETMRLTILRACRQTYVEADQILWTTNTFALDDATTFKRFMMTRNIHQKRMIRSLRLEAQWGLYGDSKEWNRALNMPLIRTLSGLRQLRLRIEYSYEANIYSKDKEQNLLYCTTYCEGMHRLSTLPLTEANIHVRNPGFDESEESQWTEADRNEFARGLINLLLNPEGANIYAANQLRKEEEIQRRKKSRLR